MTGNGPVRGLLIDGPGSPADLVPKPIAPPIPGDGEALVRVRAAAINRSDVLNVLGVPITVFPRVLGRDFAGVVIEGPTDLIGTEVWGTGSGDLGFTRDGSHAELLAVPVDGLVPRPASVSIIEAGACGLAYAAAAAGLGRTALGDGSTVLVTGAAGGVGSAACAIALWRGARVIAAVKDGAEAERAGELNPGATVIETGRPLSETVSGLTDGRGVDIAFDTVGVALFKDALACLGMSGELIVITASPGVPVDLDLFAYYRRDLTCHGVNTTRSSVGWTASLLRPLLPGFDEGALRPPSVAEVLSLDDAAAGYEAVLDGRTPGRVVFAF
jgi:NADPH:quinone reductase